MASEQEVSCYSSLDCQKLSVVVCLCTVDNVHDVSYRELREKKSRPIANPTLSWSLGWTHFYPPRLGALGFSSRSLSESTPYNFNLTRQYYEASKKARWPNGKAPDFGSGDCAFEPHVGRASFFSFFEHSPLLWIFFFFFSLTVHVWTYFALLRKLLHAENHCQP